MSRLSLRTCFYFMMVVFAFTTSVFGAERLLMENLNVNAYPGLAQALANLVNDPNRLLSLLQQLEFKPNLDGTYLIRIISEDGSLGGSNGIYGAYLIKGPLSPEIIAQLGSGKPTREGLASYDLVLFENGQALNAVNIRFPKPATEISQPTQYNLRPTPNPAPIKVNPLVNLVETAEKIGIAVGPAAAGAESFVEAGTSYQEGRPADVVGHLTTGAFLLGGAATILVPSVTPFVLPVTATVAVSGAAAYTGYNLGEQAAEGASGGSLELLAIAVDDNKVPEKGAACESTINFQATQQGAFCNTQGRQNWFSRDCSKCCEESLDRLLGNNPNQTRILPEVCGEAPVEETFYNRCMSTCNL